MACETSLELAKFFDVKNWARIDLKVDWNIREQTQAAMRTMVRDLLDRYGYPPDFSAVAIELVVQQAEALTEELIGTSES